MSRGHRETAQRACAARDENERPPREPDKSPDGPHEEERRAHSSARVKPGGDIKQTGDVTLESAGAQEVAGGHRNTQDGESTEELSARKHARSTRGVDENDQWTRASRRSIPLCSGALVHHGHCPHTIPLFMSLTSLLSMLT